MKRRFGISSAVILCLVFYILFDVTDPVQLYDEFVKMVLDYSAIMSGVLKLWENFKTWPERLGMTSTGLVNWFVEALTKGEHTFGSWLFEKILALLR